MSEQIYIAKHPQLAASQDYASLRSAGIGHIERLAHKLWTDYNVHDPGITLLELLCYAITDLGYRTSYPIADLLTRQRESLGQFHTARQVMTCNPVSFTDLAKLLVDVPGVRNAWIEKNKDHAVCLDRLEKRLQHCDANDTDRQVLNGLYDVFLEFEDQVRDNLEPHHTGLPAKIPAQGGYIATGQAGIVFDCEYPVRLESVSVYAEAAGQVVVRLTRDGNLLARESFNVSRPGHKTVLPVGFDVPAGQGYRLDASGSGVKLYRNRHVPGRVEYPMGLDKLISLLGGTTGGETLNDIYYFFYDWVISFDRSGEDTGEGPSDVQLARSDVLKSVRQRLHQHRNLGEDPVRLCELRPEEVAVCADLELRPGANAEQVLAEIFVRLREHVSPPVRFYSLQEMLDKGRSSEEIFAGPALDNGFIDAEEFAARRRVCEIRASDVTAIIMAVDGVLAVHKLSLLAFEKDAEAPHAQDSWLLPLSHDRTKAPLFKWERSQIVFYQSRLPYYPDREQVAVLLRERREADSGRRARSSDVSHDLPVPRGKDRSPEDFYPAQNELPMTYRVGEYRVPATDSLQRHGQSRQLKAYLMFFEQLLANYLSQLAHMYELFSWDPAHERTYFTQLVEGIADIEESFQAVYADEAPRFAMLEEIVESADLAAERRNGFLDHLLARFCEDFTDYSLLVYDLYDKPAADQRVMGDKRAFLADYPRLSADRGRAHDYRFPRAKDNLSGYAERLYRLLGFADVERRPLAGQGLNIDDTGPSASEPWQFRLKKAGKLLFESRGCENRESTEVLLDLALQLAGDADNYRASGDLFELVMDCSGDDEARIIGWTGAGVDLDTVVAYFAKLADARGFHLVENILLRPRSELDPLLPVQLDQGSDCPCVEVLDPYSFRVSIVLPSWPKEFQDARVRKHVEDKLRRELPAHLTARICWVSHGQMQAFERAYLPWQKLLAQICEGEPDCLAPGIDEELQAAYARSLEALVRVMYSLDNVHPLAQLQDCGKTQGKNPRVFLDHSNLGTF